MSVRKSITLNNTIGFDMDIDLSNPLEADLLYYLENRQVPEPEVVYLMLHAVHPGDFVIDGGAAIGFFTLLLSRLVGPDGRVVAIEPAPANVERLRHNIEINGMTNVDIVQKALWSEAGLTKKLLVSEHGGFNSLHSSINVKSQCEVLTTTLPEIEAGRKVKLIKLDIEGSEVEAMLAYGPCRLSRLVVAEANERALREAGESIIELRYTMLACGLKTFLLSSQGSLPALVPQQTLIRTNRENTNLLFGSLDEVCCAWPEVMA